MIPPPAKLARVRAMRTLPTLAALTLLALASTSPARAEAPPEAAANDHVIGADRVGPFTLGAASKDVIDAALKAFSKSDVKLGDRDLQLPGLKLKFSAAGAKGVLNLIEVTKSGLGKSKYLTAEGVGPGSSEKDIRLAYREAVKRAKVGKLESLTPDSLPNVHFICSKGGVFSSESCKTVTLSLPRAPKKSDKPEKAEKSDKTEK